MTRAAMLSPVPPAPTGVAEYTRDLAPRLARLVELSLYAPRPAAPDLAGVPLRPLEEFDRAADLPLVYYHMGNNTQHRFVHERLLRRPGVVVLHDLVLHHFYIEETLARGDVQAYLELVRELGGWAGERIAAALRDGLATGMEPFFTPLFERVVGASRGVIVHNARAARLIAGRVPGALVSVVPMGIPDPGEDPLPSRERARERLGLTADDFVVGLFGFLTPMKRPQAVVRAFSILAARESRARLAVVGEVSPAVGLRALLAGSEAASRVHVTGYVTASEFRAWAAASDVVVNLRYPTAGETSASLLKLMGWGKPVVVSEYAQFRELPRDVVWHLPVGEGEAEALAELLGRLARAPEELEERGQAAARHVAEQHRVEEAARQYAAFGEAAMSREPPGLPPLPPEVPTTRLALPLGARIEGKPLPPVRAGSPLCLDVVLHNQGPARWLRRWDAAGGYVTLRPWLIAEGGIEALEEKAIPTELPPGQAMRMSYQAWAPARPGRYRLVVDLVVSRWGRESSRGGEALVYDLEVT